MTRAGAGAGGLTFEAARGQQVNGRKTVPVEGLHKIVLAEDSSKVSRPRAQPIQNWIR